MITLIWTKFQNHGCDKLDCGWTHTHRHTLIFIKIDLLFVISESFSIVDVNFNLPNVLHCQKCQQ